jgi:hypothetical protein
MCEECLWILPSIRELISRLFCLLYNNVHLETKIEIEIITLTSIGIRLKLILIVYLKLIKGTGAHHSKLAYRGMIGKGLGFKKIRQLFVLTVSLTLTMK